MFGCHRDLLHLPVWVDRCMWHSVLDEEIKSRHTGMLRQPCSFQSFLGLAFAAVSLLFTDPLVGFFKLEGVKTILDAKIYMRITCGLILFSFLNLTLTGLYTAQGDSKTPFVANFIGLLINLLLDPLLILGVGPFPRIEVAGAAVATVSAQLVVMLVMMVGVFRSKKEENVLKGIRLFEPFSKEELETSVRSEVLRQYREWYTV